MNKMKQSNLKIDMQYSMASNCSDFKTSGDCSSLSLRSNKDIYNLTKPQLIDFL